MICHYWFFHECVQPSLTFQEKNQSGKEEKLHKKAWLTCHWSLSLRTATTNRPMHRIQRTLFFRLSTDLPCSMRADCNRSVNLNLIANWHRQTNVITSHLTTVICIHITFKWLLQHVILCRCCWTVLFFLTIICVTAVACASFVLPMLAAVILSLSFHSADSLKQNNIFICIDTQKKSNKQSRTSNRTRKSK